MIYRIEQRVGWRRGIRTNDTCTELTPFIGARGAPYLLKFQGLSLVLIKLTYNIYQQHCLKKRFSPDGSGILSQLMAMRTMAGGGRSDDGTSSDIVVRTPAARQIQADSRISSHNRK